MESTTYLLLDENGAEHAIFSGDTLFIGDVGRPDLLKSSPYDSIGRYFIQLFANKNHDAS
jgi:glyoxylase-like metal-dependent hydrolase (beta-lactamase superfamily II)